MSNPGWPDPATSPFALFGAASTPAADAAGTPLAQGLASGMEAIKNFWGSLPGGATLPGFMVPTVDVEELDKRISDLRAAESWLEVNLNMLRATVQGLEVQRHTIAAVQAWAATGNGESGAAAATPGPFGGLPAGWPMTPVAAGSAASPPAAWSSRAEGGAAGEASPQSASPEPSEVVAPFGRPAEDAAPAAGAAGMATSNWLGYMQDQFLKVAQTALAGATVPGAGGSVAPAPADAAGGDDRATRKKATAKSSTRPAGKKTAKRRPSSAR